MEEEEEEKRENLSKLSTFTKDISHSVLHVYFEMEILNKEEFSYFLNGYKHVLFHALHPAKSCCECKLGSTLLSDKPARLFHEQFNLLFKFKKVMNCHKRTQHCLCNYLASVCVKVSDLDISLVYAIVNICCPSNDRNSQCIKDVKDTRNFLAHPNSDRFTKDEYDTKLTTLENATLHLANVVGSTILKMIQRQISNFKKDVVFSETLKGILASSNDDVCKRLEPLMRNLVIQQFESMSKDTIDHMKKYTDELLIKIGKLIFEVKHQICEQLSSQKITEESGEPGYATSTPQTAHPQRTQSRNENKCCVVWKVSTPDTWKVSKIKDALQNLSCILKEWFEIEFVYIGSLVIRTIVPEHRLSNYDDFKSAVRSFLAKIVEVCQLDTDTHTVVKVDLNIFTEIPPTDISTNVNKEYKKSTLTSPCHYCKEELVCDNCTTDERLELPVSTDIQSSESADISTNVNKEHKKSTLTSPCHYCKEELVCDNCTTHGLPVSTDIQSSESDCFPLLTEDDKVLKEEESMRREQSGYKTDSDLVTCDVCKKMFKTERGLHIHHSRVHKGDSVTCDVCGRRFETERAHRIHHLRIHPGIWESIFKGEMEERFQKEHMKMRLDYNPSTFKSGTESVKFSQDDSMIDKEIGKIEHFRPIRLEHDITVPKSADILPRWDMKDKDDSKSSTEKH